MYGVNYFVDVFEQNRISKEVKVISMEKVNWWVKGTSFLKAKFKKEKYGKSF